MSIKLRNQGVHTEVDGILPHADENDRRLQVNECANPVMLRARACGDAHISRRCFERGVDRLRQQALEDFSDETYSSSEKKHVKGLRNDRPRARYTSSRTMRQRRRAKNGRRELK